MMIRMEINDIIRSRKISANRKFKFGIERKLMELESSIFIVNVDAMNI